MPAALVKFLAPTDQLWWRNPHQRPWGMFEKLRNLYVGNLWRRNVSLFLKIIFTRILDYRTPPEESGIVAGESDGTSKFVRVYCAMWSTMYLQRQRARSARISFKCYSDFAETDTRIQCDVTRTKQINTSPIWVWACVVASFQHADFAVFQTCPTAADEDCAIIAGPLVPKTLPEQRACTTSDISEAQPNRFSSEKIS